jgi:hypothetical protein
MSETGRFGKALQMVRENRLVGASIGLQDVGDWTFWKSSADGEGKSISWCFHWTTRCRRLDILESSATAEA